MIDTHSHLYAEQFDEDIVQTIQRAKEVGLQHIFLPNIDEESIPRLNKLIELDSTMFKRMMGLHPCSVDGDYKEVLARVKEELDNKDCIAVGEIGIDLYWDKSKRKEQEDAFLMQCEWAHDKDLPIAIHSRESTDIIIDLINNHYPSKLKGVFHCFVGDNKQAQEILEMGYYLGIGGVVTFKNSKLRDELVDIPLDRIIIETDSPYLAPVPYRGKRNESAYVIEVVKELSKIYNVSEEVVKEITTKNALTLFKL